MSLFEEEDDNGQALIATDAEAGNQDLDVLASLAERWSWKTILEETDAERGGNGAVTPDVARRQLKFAALAAFYKQDRYGRDRCRNILSRLEQNPTSGPLEKLLIALLRADLNVRDDPHNGGGWSDQLDAALDAAKSLALMTGAKNADDWSLGERLHRFRSLLFTVEREGGYSLAPFLETSEFLQVDGLRRFLELPATWNPDPAFVPAVRDPQPGPPRSESAHADYDEENAVPREPEIPLPPPTVGERILDALRRHRALVLVSYAIVLVGASAQVGFSVGTVAFWIVAVVGAVAGVVLGVKLRDPQSLPEPQPLPDAALLGIRIEERVAHWAPRIKADGGARLLETLLQHFGTLSSAIENAPDAHVPFTPEVLSSIHSTIRDHGTGENGDLDQFLEELCRDIRAPLDILNARDLVFRVLQAAKQ